MVLADTIDWQFLSEKLGDVYTAGPGQPPLPTRLMAGLHILKHADDLSDEEVCARWVITIGATLSNSIGELLQRLCAICCGGPMWRRQYGPRWAVEKRLAWRR